MTHPSKRRQRIECRWARTEHEHRLARYRRKRAYAACRVYQSMKLRVEGRFAKAVEQSIVEAPCVLRVWMIAHRCAEFVGGQIPIAADRDEDLTVHVSSPRRHCGRLNRTKR